LQGKKSGLKVEKELCVIEMALSTLAFGKMIKYKERVNSVTPVAMSMRESLLMVLPTAMVNMSL
jgi:hypothetical protein